MRPAWHSAAMLASSMSGCWDAEARLLLKCVKCGPV